MSSMTSYILILGVNRRNYGIPSCLMRCNLCHISSCLCPFSLCCSHSAFAPKTLGCIDVINDKLHLILNKSHSLKKEKLTYVFNNAWGHTPGFGLTQALFSFFHRKLSHFGPSKQFTSYSISCQMDFLLTRISMLKLRSDERVGRDVGCKLPLNRNTPLPLLNMSVFECAMHQQKHSRPKYIYKTIH